jgi:hypothetical protein
MPKASNVPISIDTRMMPPKKAGIHAWGRSEGFA